MVDEEVRRGMFIAGSMVVGLLAEGAFEALENLSGYLSADQFRSAVAAFGQPLLDTPDEDWSLVAIECRDVDGVEVFDFVAPLWTSQGRSGIGMAMRLIPTAYGTFSVEIPGFVSVDVDPVVDARLDSPPVPRGEGAGRRSDNPVPDRWRAALESIVHRLVLGDYAGLAADGMVRYADGPNDATIGRWIERYPGRLVDLPPEGWTYSDHGRWGNEPEAWWVVVPLWTAEEGRSDLSMEATVWDDGASVTAKVDNVHVM